MLPIPNPNPRATRHPLTQFLVFATRSLFIVALLGFSHGAALWLGAMGGDRARALWDKLPEGLTKAFPAPGDGGHGSHDGHEGHNHGAYFPAEAPRANAAGARIGVLAPQVIYMNREGAQLTAGRDDAASNTSSLVAGAKMDGFEVPAFRGSAKRWDRLMKCVRKHFEPYNVVLTDRRPIQPGYRMVVVGGTAGQLGKASGHKRAAGLAPLAKNPVDDAIALVFSKTLRLDDRAMCETAVHEIGHTFGLDHSYACKDPMTYRTGCGRKAFVDAHAPCGEGKARKCLDGSETQNSHEKLLKVIGPRQALPDLT